MISYRIIGLMSGTSMDGLDIADVTFTKDNTNNWQHQILKTSSVTYPNDILHKLGESRTISSEELLYIDKELGKFFACEVNTFINENSINKNDIHALASHGHTVFHQPNKGFTLQIGCGATIAANTKINVINDFRTKDVIAGGQGAPLVPIGDSLLFSHLADGFLNIGGFANLCALRDPIIAFDISPGNLPINELMQEYYQQNFDNDGLTAKSGCLIPSLLQKLNTIDYYSLPSPKSLGTEWLDTKFNPIIKTFPDNKPKDIIHTVTTHIAQQISTSLRSLDVKKVMITGGGAYNSFLIDLIKKNFKGEILLPSNELIEFKEAIIFAFLGALHLNNSANTIPSVTGAAKAVIGGVKHLY